MTISIKYEVDRVLDSPYREIIENTVLAALGYGGCPYEAEINVILADDDAIREINREHRRADVPTNVLPFPMVDYESPSDFDYMEEIVENYLNPGTGELMLGDIVISVGRVKEQAGRYGHSRTRELAPLTTCSILHPFGYNHVEDGERLAMEEK